MTCTVATSTRNISTRCRVCKTPLGDGIPIHFVVVEAIDEFPVPVCAACCPDHQSKVYEGDPVTVSGKQDSLF